MGRSARFLMAALLALHGPAAAAGGGAGELSLDRAAVRALLQAALPGPTPLSLPGLPDLVLRVAPPVKLSFAEGGIETVLPLTLDGIGYEGALRVRYVPEIGRLDGVVRLVPESAVPEAALPVTLDLGAFLPDVELPRSLGWALEGPGSRPVEVLCLVQGLEVGEDRLVVRFGLTSRKGR